MSRAGSYFDALCDAQARGDFGFGLRLIPEAANDVFDSAEAPTGFDSMDPHAAMLMTAIAFSFASRGLRIPSWADISRLPRATYLAPEEFLDDTWRAEIQSATPQLFASKNIWLSARDLQVA